MAVPGLHYDSVWQADPVVLWNCWFVSVKNLSGDKEEADLYCQGEGRDRILFKQLNDTVKRLNLYFPRLKVMLFYARIKRMTF